MVAVAFQSLSLNSPPKDEYTEKSTSPLLVNNVYNQTTEPASSENHTSYFSYKMISYIAGGAATLGLVAAGITSFMCREGECNLQTTATTLAKNNMPELNKGLNVKPTQGVIMDVGTTLSGIVEHSLMFGDVKGAAELVATNVAADPYLDIFLNELYSFILVCSRRPKRTLKNEQRRTSDHEKLDEIAQRLKHPDNQKMVKALFDHDFINRIDVGILRGHSGKMEAKGRIGKYHLASRLNAMPKAKLPTTRQSPGNPAATAIFLSYLSQHKATGG